MQGSTLEKISYWLFADKIPLTKFLIVSNVATFLAITLFQLNVIAAFTAFNSMVVRVAPWTVLTYPLVCVNDGIIGLLFACYWLWWAGGSLERTWGTRTFATYFFILSALSALGLYAGSVLTGVPVILAGLWLPIAGITVSYAMLNPEQQILFMLFIPLKLKYLAILDVVMVLISYGRSNLLLGVCALAGCAYAFWYVRPDRFRMPERQRRGQVVRVHGKGGVLRKLNPFAWIRSYRDRQRLKKLFERSDFKEGGPDDR